MAQEVDEREDWISVEGNESNIFRHREPMCPEYLEIDVKIILVHNRGAGIPFYRVVASSFRSGQLEHRPDYLDLYFVPPLHWSVQRRRDALLSCAKFTEFQDKLHKKQSLYETPFAHRFLRDEVVGAILADSFFRMR